MIEAQESITGTISGTISINSVINNGVVIPEETDPTVPAHVKAITEEQIANWENGSNIDLSNYYTKADVDQKGYITEEQVDNKGYTTEEDIATYVEANKETLRGPQGEQGPKGDKGDKADTPEFEKEINGPTLTIEDGKKVKVFEIEGNSYQETEPTPDYPQEVEVIEGSVDVKVTGKNLISFDMFVEKVIPSINGGQNVTSDGCMATSYIEIDNTLPMCLSIVPTEKIKYVFFYDENYSFLGHVSNLYNMKVSDNDYYKSAKYIRVRIDQTKSQITEIQLEYSEKVTEYEPYKETIKKIDLQDNFLAKIGNVKDELDVVTGKLTKRIGKVVLDGSTDENWNTYTSNSGDKVYATYINDYKKTSGITCMCDKFIPTNNSGYGVLVNGQCNLRNANDTYNLFYACTNNFSTIAELKTWLASNNVEVYYVLAEPYEVQLTPSTIPMEEGKVNKYSVTNPLVENLYCKYYTQYRGDDGLTPVKGVDYFTEADKQELIASMPSGGGNIATIEPEEGENYIYFFPNVVNKGLVDGTYFLTKTLKLATDSVSNTSGVSNNTTLFAFDTLVEIKEYIDANNSSIKSYDFIALNGNTFFITTENGVITEVMQSTLVTKDYVDKAIADAIANLNTTEN